ncbi:MAG TPA: hypothetical protein DEO84_07385 [candidate division Zixibacteria bacterium]|nr:hypothetical protein [candidate division Zixibacteria bacterium]
MAPPDSVQKILPPAGDTLAVSQSQIDESQIPSNDTLFPAISIPESLVAETLSTEIAPTIFHDRIYLSKGPADEIKSIAGIFMRSPGPVGSPAIPLEYLNVSDLEIKLNGLPFPYQGLYRPYVIGTDINTIPWEILNSIEWNPRNGYIDGLDFQVGRPADNSNRSDIVIDRGGYRYDAAHWRFFRPFGNKTYAYFTVGFKKSGGYLPNSNYDAFHVTGGVSRKIGNGELSMDLWQHKAKAKQNSFDYLTSQISKQKRTVDRGEIHYKTSRDGRYFLSIAGLLQKNFQTITGYTSPRDENYSVGGVQAALSDSTSERIWSGGFEYYRFSISKIAGPHPFISQFEPSVRMRGNLSSIDYDLKTAYSWNKVDNGAILPSAKLSYNINERQKPFVELLRSRRDPDLNLLYFNDNVEGLNLSQRLHSYRFIGNQTLSMPLTSQVTAGLESDWGQVNSIIGLSLKRIGSQIYLVYSKDSLANVIVTPTNFDDRFLEFFAKARAESGPISGEVSGAYRRWSKRFFSDDLEKGPAALGFARLSYLKEYFIRRLYLGGSLEARFSSRRDYRSIDAGLTGSYAIISGRFEFRYKDLTIWLSDENILNTAYITWWPYYESPRNVWVGMMWDFFD